jgi:hypothetical protein
VSRLGETDGKAVLDAHWNKSWGGTAGDDVLAAALEEAESKASALDLENAKLRLSLVRVCPGASCGFLFVFKPFWPAWDGLYIYGHVLENTEGQETGHRLARSWGVKAQTSALMKLEQAKGPPRHEQTTCRS